MAEISLKVGLIFFLGEIKATDLHEFKVGFIAFECCGNLVHPGIYYIVLGLKRSTETVPTTGFDSGRLCLRS